MIWQELIRYVVGAIWYFAVAIAAARISVLIVHDTILEPLRHKAFLKWPPRDNGHIGYEYQTMDQKTGAYLNDPENVRDWHMLAELFTCTRCVTVWASGILLGGEYLLGRDTLLPVVVLFAVAGIASWQAKKQ